MSAWKNLLKGKATHYIHRKLKTRIMYLFQYKFLSISKVVLYPRILLPFQWIFADIEAKRLKSKNTHKANV